jgi:hypothetical protein
VVQSQTGEIACETLSQKKKRQHKKRAGGVPQVVECLPSKHEFKSQYCQKKKKKRVQTLEAASLLRQAPSPPCASSMMCLLP